MNVQGVHHLALQVRALAPMVAFYRDVLGLPVLAEHRAQDGQLHSVWMGLSGAFLALETVVAEAPAATPFRNRSPGWFLVALRIAPEERNQVRAELERAQVTVEHETRWTLYVRDPEGNRLALSHHPLTAEEE
ncbi:MAG: VOC family protein [Myxococcaceae bacterium]